MLNLKHCLVQFNKNKNCWREFGKIKILSDMIKRISLLTKKNKVCGIWEMTNESEVHLEASK